MIVDVSKFKNFVKIVGVGSLGNFQAKREGNKLFASVASANNASLIQASLPANFDEDEEVEINANNDILSKMYLDIFSKGEITIATSDDAITLTDGSLTLYAPQIDPEVAKRNTKTLKGDLKFDTKVVFPADNFHKIYRAAQKLQESLIWFIVEEGKLRFEIENKAKVKCDAEVEGKDLRLPFRIFVLDDTLAKSDGLVTMKFNSEDSQHPVNFSFEVDEIEVNGFMMPASEVEEEEEDEDE